MNYERIKQEEFDGVTVARLLDRKLLDELVIERVGGQLYALVDEQHCSQLILDFRNVEYMASTFLGKLCKLQKKLDEARGTLVLCELRPEITALFEFARLRAQFILTDTRELALEQF